MDPGYQMVMDPATVVWGALAMVPHLGVMLAQVGVALFLAVSGRAWRHEAGSAWRERSGSDGVLNR